MSSTRRCARPVHDRVHVPCTGPCTRHVHDRRRPYRRPVHSHVHGWCRRTRPIHGRVRTVYTARPLYGRVRTVFAGENVFTCARVTGTRHVTRPCTRPVRGRTTAVYTAVDMDTVTRTCNCRVDFPCTPYTWRCSVCVHVSPAHGPCTRTWTGRPVYAAAYMALTFTRPVHGDNAASR